MTTQRSFWQSDAFNGYHAADDAAHADDTPTPTATQTKSEAIERVTRNANPAWFNAAIECVRSVARRLPEFTMDDVVPVLEVLTETTHDNRARGGLMRSAASRGICVYTGRDQYSERPETHRKKIGVYRSLIFAP